MVALIASLVIVAVAIMIIVSQRQSVKNMKTLLKEAQEKSIQLEKKVSSSRDELKKSKEELEREKNALRDARELSKKKLRRHAIAEINPETLPNEAAMTNKALDDKDKAISALEAQIEQLKREQNQNENAIKTRLAEESQKKESDNNVLVEELKKKIESLGEELKKQKRLMRPEGNKIDLKTLPDEAASEFARLYRKAEQHERLHGIARAKLHLAQEKFTELQRKYFSVCSELALLAGNKKNLEPKQARDIAEKIVADHNVSNDSNDAGNERA